MLFKSLLTLAVGGVAARQLAARRQDKLDRERELSQRTPRSENRWEGEGGALHESGAQLGPAPQQP